MNDSVFDTPILFMAFNRPDVTRVVFRAIREIRPQRLYIAADGPRPDVPADVANCAEVRAIALEVDWDCEVQTLYREQNLGCMIACTEAIRWFFDQEEEGIVLEDDCLPSASFFPYCASLLEKYRTDARIVHINGNNFNTQSVLQTTYSYHFVRYPQVWGWATWKRAWDRFDASLALFPDFDDYSFFKYMGITKKEFLILRKRWQDVYQRKINNVWDYQWHFINFLEGNLVVAPKQNLVSNLGFQENATHTVGSDPLKEKLPVGEIAFPLIHPPCLFVDNLLNANYKNFMVHENIMTKVKRKLFSAKS